MEQSSFRVLLVEDNPGDAKLIQEELSGGMDTFFDVVTAGSLQEAFSRIEEEKSIDVIISDLNLPDSNGIETFGKLHEKDKSLPIIVLSGTKDESLALNAVQKGAQDYLVKGEVDNTLLTRTIRHAIERHKVYKELEQAKAELEKYKSGVRPQ